MPEINLNPLDHFQEEIPTHFSDRKAKKELDEDYSRKRRKIRELSNLHWAFVVLIWVITACICGIIIAVVLNDLLPLRLEWLSENQINDLYKIFTNTALGGAIAAFFSKKLQSVKD